MKIAVVGLWHLGSVIAGCLAAAGFDVLGYDADSSVVHGLSEGRPPLFEPGLQDAIRSGLSSGKLRFTTRADDLRTAELVWVAHDTPVDDEDRADVELVMRQVIDLFPALNDEVLVLISSQLPVGSTRRLEEEYKNTLPQGQASFAYSPENLRLGSAIEAFTKPDRIVVGVRSEADRQRLGPVLRRFGEHIEWMGVESAEMTKHAINAFLAASVTFINEIAGLCERVGADAREVERGLKTEARIGPRARLKPGAAFAGGTLARDVAFLEAIGKKTGRPTNLVSSIRISNDSHKGWSRHRLGEALGTVRGKRVAVLGLTYKAGTDTLRRSSALELCRWLLTEGAHVTAFDPAVLDHTNPALGGIDLARSVESALDGAAAAVIATEWPEFARLEASLFVSRLSAPATVLDPNGQLEKTLGSDARVRYLTVGRP
jgi:UDPglucose 6-dehydrogenase